MNSFPDTALVAEARRIAQSSLTPSIFQHSQRVFLLGRAYARARAVKFDEEDLLLAALFHDLGLSDSFANRSKAFTEIGADLAEQFMTQHGAPARGQQLAEAIDLHMQLLPRWSHGPVVALLQIGAWMDASKRRAASVERGLIASVEAEFPRAEFDSEFRARLWRSFGSLRACTRLVFPAARVRQ